MQASQELRMISIEQRSDSWFSASFKDKPNESVFGTTLEEAVGGLIATYGTDLVTIQVNGQRYKKV